MRVYDEAQSLLLASRMSGRPYDPEFEQVARRLEVLADAEFGAHPLLSVADRLGEAARNVRHPDQWDRVLFLDP